MLFIINFNLVKNVLLLCKIIETIIAEIAKKDKNRDIAKIIIFNSGYKINLKKIVIIAVKITFTTINNRMFFI